MLKIVVLDRRTISLPEDSWDPLRTLGAISAYEHTSDSEILTRIEDADIVITNKVMLNEQTLHDASKLKYIGVSATGFNCIDVNAARRSGIAVTNVPRYSTASAAQHTFALLLELTNHVGIHAASTRSMDWCRTADFSYSLAALTELSGKTLGIVGLGQIGKAVARIALAFGMQVIASHTHPERDAMDGVRFVSLKQCFSDSDIVSLHCPLTSTNQEFVNKDLIALMRPSAFFLNVSRGALVAEEDLAAALNEGRIAGAALDVLSFEPPRDGNPLLRAKNCLVTPHIAWATFESRTRLLAELTENLLAFLRGEKRNRVD